MTDTEGLPPRRRTRESVFGSKLDKSAEGPKPATSGANPDVDQRRSKTRSTPRRQNLPDGNASTDGKPADSSESNPDTVKLRKVLALRAEGRTQKQIADEFGKDVRTIQRWVEKARRQKLVVLEKLSPEEVLADFLFGNAQLSWNLHRQLKAAEDARDTFLVLKCVREITHLAAARIAVLARVGLFDRVSFPGLKSGAPGQEGVARLHQAVRNAESDTYEVAEENSGSEEGDDQESLY